MPDSEGKHMSLPEKEEGMQKEIETKTPAPIG